MSQNKTTTKQATKKTQKEVLNKEEPKVEVKEEPKVEIKEEQVGGENVDDKVIKKKRHFKVIVEGKEFADAKGRFSGNKPKQAANKALTSIVKQLLKDNQQVPEHIKFTLVESTRKKKEDPAKLGRAKSTDKKKKVKKPPKQYHYVGSKKASTIAPVIIAKKDKKEEITKEILHKHKDLDVNSQEFKKLMKEKMAPLKKKCMDITDDKVLESMGFKRVVYKYSCEVKKDKEGKYIEPPKHNNAAVNDESEEEKPKTKKVTKKKQDKPQKKTTQKKSTTKKAPKKTKKVNDTKKDDKKEEKKDDKKEEKKEEKKVKKTVKKTK